MQQAPQTAPRSLQGARWRDLLAAARPKSPGGASRAARVSGGARRRAAAQRAKGGTEAARRGRPDKGRPAAASGNAGSGGPTFISALRRAATAGAGKDRARAGAEVRQQRGGDHVERVRGRTQQRKGDRAEETEGNLVPELTQGAAGAGLPVPTPVAKRSGTGERRSPAASDAPQARERAVRVSRAEGTAATAGATAPRIVVVDLRAEAGGQTNGAGRKARNPELSTAKGGDGSGALRAPGLVLLTPRPSERASEGPSGAARAAQPSSEAPRQAGAGRAAAPAVPVLQSRFAEVVREEVLRHASVIVRDGGEGEIRLVLKPESLGEVRIRMKVVEDSIEGRIVVQNTEARDLFQDNLASLEATLRGQGFQSARLDVAVSDGGGERGRAREPGPAATMADAAEELERNGSYVLLTDAHAVDMVV